MRLAPADLVTLANGFAGLLAIMYIQDGLFPNALLLLYLAVILDGLDGRVAALSKAKRAHGVYLDAIADTFSFCFAPAMLIYGFYYDINRGSALFDFQNAVAVGVAFLVAALGMLRLARFVEHGKKLSHFEGIPTTAVAFFIVAYTVLIPEIIPWPLPVYFLVSVAGLSCLMYSRVRYPMVSGWLMTSLAASGVLVGFFSLLVPESSLFLPLASYAFLVASVYVIFGPTIQARKAVRG